MNIARPIFSIRTISGFQSEVASFYRQHVTAALIPLAAGIILYGWAALATAAIVVASAAAGLLVWSHIGRRGRQINTARCLWMALLLSLTLPPHLLSPREQLWPILIAAGLFLVMVEWLLATVGSGGVDPVLAAYLILFILFQSALTPHLVLKVNRVLTGEIFNAEAIDMRIAGSTPWVYNRESTPNGIDAFDDHTLAAAELSNYTSGRLLPDRFSISALMVLRDRLPPLENLVVGGEPGPVGASSAAAVIVGGLMLIHMGLVDFRIPLLAAASALAAFLILPVPAIITESGPQWQWLAFRAAYLGPGAAISLAGYELFASPLLFVSFFVATSPRSRPISRRGCAAHGILLGLLAAPLQLYGSVAVGPYVALLLTCLTSRVMDRIFPPRTLV